MDDSIKTAEYYAPNYTALPTRQCLVCGTLENYSVYMPVIDASLPWLCDRCRGALLKLIDDANTSKVADRNVGKWIEKKFSRFTYYKCSVCNANYECENAEFDLNFCPNCGADMRGKEDG